MNTHHTTQNMKMKFMLCAAVFREGEGGKSNFDFSRPTLLGKPALGKTCECATKVLLKEWWTEWSPWMNEMQRRNG